MRVLENLGKLRIDQGRFAEAEPLLRDVLKSQRRLGSNKRGATLGTMNTLAVSLTKKKDYTEAEELFEEVFEDIKGKFVPEHNRVLKIKNDFGVF